jgi:hypothetical protein
MRATPRSNFGRANPTKHSGEQSGAKKPGAVSRPGAIPQFLFPD